MYNLKKMILPAIIAMGAIAINCFPASCQELKLRNDENIISKNDAIETEIIEENINEIEETAIENNDKQEGIEESKPIEEISFEDEEVSDEPVEEKYEKADSLSPVLIVDGEPDDEQSRVEQKAELEGRLIAEKHPLGRRKNLYRWVLELADKSRIPLKSNLKLLQTVKNEDMLDGYVKVSGVWLKSEFSSPLRFLRIENIRMIDELTEVNEESENEIALVASETDNLKHEEEKNQKSAEIESSKEKLTNKIDPKSEESINASDSFTEKLILEKKD